MNKLKKPYIANFAQHLQQDGSVIETTSTIVGGSEDRSLWFGLHWIRWWGSCNPEAGGYRHLFWCLYKER